MRKAGVIFFIIVSCLFIYMSINTSSNGYSVGGRGVIEEDSALPFRKGERLTYEVRYKKLKVGKSILTFRGEEELDNKKVYHVTFVTELPALKDTEDLYAEKDSFLPLEVHRKIKKLKAFTSKIREKYDQENFIIDITEKGSIFSKKFSIKKDSKIHNAILLTYLYRTRKDFSRNEKFKIKLPTADFEVMFDGIKTVKTPMGEYRAYVFSSNPSKFKFWLSADDKRIPLKIENPGALGYSLVIKSID